MKPIHLVLKENRIRSGIPVSEVIESLKNFGISISPKTLYGYENSVNNPPANTVMALCSIYGIDNVLEEFGVSAETELRACSTDFYSSDEREIIKKYRALDQRGQNAVIETLNREYDYITAADEAAKQTTGTA